MTIKILMISPDQFFTKNSVAENFKTIHNIEIYQKEVRSYTQAVVALKVVKFDMVLVDDNTPATAGIDFSRHLKDKYPYVKVKVFHKKEKQTAQVKHNHINNNEVWGIKKISPKEQIKTSARKGHIKKGMFLSMAKK